MHPQCSACSLRLVGKREDALYVRLSIRPELKASKQDVEESETYCISEGSCMLVSRLLSFQSQNAVDDCLAGKAGEWYATLCYSFSKILKILKHRNYKFSFEQHFNACPGSMPG